MASSVVDAIKGSASKLTSGAGAQSEQGDKESVNNDNISNHYN